MISVKLFKQKDFCLLKNDWKKLENGCDMTAFQSYSWYSLINEQYRRKSYFIPGKVVYAAAYVNGEIKMIAPLFIVRLPSVVEKYNVDNGAHILGKWGYTDYLNFIYSDFSEECFEQIVSAVRKKYRVSAFNIHQILPDTSMRTYLDSKYTSSLLFEGDCVKVPVYEDFDSYYKVLSKNFRQNLRTARNRADNDGIDIHYELLNKISEKDAAEFFDIYCSRQRIKQSGGQTSGKNPAASAVSLFFNYKRNKYNILINTMTSLENSFILGCFSGTEKIGLCLGLEDEKGIRIPIVCFKQDFSRYSPCILCIHQFLKDSYENKTVKTFDLLKGSEQYKLNLGGEKFSIGYYKISL